MLYRIFLKKKFEFFLFIVELQLKIEKFYLNGEKGSFIKKKNNRETITTTASDQTTNLTINLFDQSTQNWPFSKTEGRV